MCKLSEKKVIAITGIIGSGKSTVSNLLKERGYPVLDCDQGSRECIKKGSAGYQQMLDTFTETILDEEKNIDRKKVAALIFADHDRRKQLESIQHPLILDWVQKECEASSEPLVFVEVPLLFECGWKGYFDESWVVVADENIVYKRLKQDRAMSEDEIKRRLDTQMKSELKMKKADHVIVNNGSLIELNQQIDKLLSGVNKSYGKR